MEEEYVVVRRKRDWLRDVGLGCLIVAGALGATLIGYILWWK